MVKALCTRYQITSSSVELGCDGLGALNQVSDGRLIISLDSSHFYMISATRWMISKCPIQWKFRNIFEHQDDIPTKVLDRWATLNVEMDAGAKALWDETYLAAAKRATTH
jgi:hypothetical protein